MRHTQTSKARTHSKLSLFAFLVLFTVSVSGVALWRLQSVQVMSVESNSMAPAIRRGDAVVLQSVDTNRLKVGDIVSYRSPADQAVIITHRVVVVERNWNQVITKGDNASRDDKPIPTTAILGRVNIRVAYLGFALSFLRSPAGLIASVYIPAGVIVLLELRRLASYYAKPTYRLLAYEKH